MSELPQRVQFDNQLFIREETNGTTVHEPDTNTIKFLENVPFNNFMEVNSLKDATSLLARHEATGSVSRNIELTRPLRVNWLASLACNLVCVYCYAEDKMDQKRATAPEIFNTIDELSPLSIAITGGEPLMSPYLIDALRQFNGKYGLIIDTNGTVKIRDEMLDLLKEANATVRVTIDATEKNLLNSLRPSRSSHEYEPQKILDTITSLGRIGIRTAVHTVITSQNIAHLDEVGDKLVDMGVKTWQLYPVEYTHTYRASYPFLRVSKEQIDDARSGLENNFGDSIYVRVYDQREATDGGRSVVLIENNGNIVLDNIGEDSVETIIPGEDTLGRVMRSLNVPQHTKDYLYQQ